MNNHVVATLVYDQLCTFEFGCAVEVFGLVRPELGVPWYQFAACSTRRGKIKAMGGITLIAPYSLNFLDKANTIIVPGWRELDFAPDVKLIKKIRSAYERGARIVSVCSGVFLLAAAGILDGKKATTHWLYVEKLKKLYPNIQVEYESLYVDEGQIITSAGSAAGLDMFLYMIQKDHGTKIANQVAQRMVIPPHRDGGQAQFVPRPMDLCEIGHLSKLMIYVRKNLSQSHSVESLAKKATTSIRTLQRQFQEATGLSPYEWLIRERIGMTKELLESTSMSLARIAEKVGFHSEETLRKHFRRYVLTSPIAYRKQFNKITL